MTNKGRRRQYLIPLLVGIGFAVVFLWSRGTLGKTDAQELLRDVSDAFFIPGVLLVCVGGLLFVAGNGIFDMLNFGVMKVLSLVRSDKYRAKQPRTYYDYVSARNANRRGGYSGLLWVGLIFLLLAAAFVALYMTV